MLQAAQSAVFSHPPTPPSSALLYKNRTVYQLRVNVAHVQLALCCLAHHRKHLYQQAVCSTPLLPPL